MTAPNVKTPLLPATGEQHYHSASRVPTFMQSSIPTRRTILHACLDMTVHLLFELVLPIALYYVLHLYFSPLVSLLLAGVPPILAVIVKGFWEHKVDMLAVLMIFGFIFSAALALVQSDPKLYLLRESVMTLAMGLMLLMSLVPFRFRRHVLRPFMFYVGRQVALSGTVDTHPATVRDHWNWLWDCHPSFRYFFRALTAICAVGLLSEFLVRVALVMTLDDIEDIIYYSNVYALATMVFLGVLTLAAALLFRHLYNRKQTALITMERQREIDAIIARASAERAQ